MAGSTSCNILVTIAYSNLYYEWQCLTINNLQATCKGNSSRMSFPLASSHPKRRRRKKRESAQSQKMRKKRAVMMASMLAKEAKKVIA